VENYHDNKSTNTPDWEEVRACPGYFMKNDIFFNILEE